MAAAHSAPSEVATSEEEQDPVKEVIRWVVKTLMKEEEQALVTDMLKYSNNLSQQLLNHRPTYPDLRLVLRLADRSGRSGASSERKRPLSCSSGP